MCVSYLTTRMNVRSSRYLSFWMVVRCERLCEAESVKYIRSLL
jgi:hypothetical protein